MFSLFEHLNCMSNVISSWVHSHFFFLLFFYGAILIGPSSIFLEHWALPNGNISLGPQVAKFNKSSRPYKTLFIKHTTYSENVQRY
jgi:hypothetical protein